MEESQQVIIFQCSIDAIPPGINRSYQIVKHTNKQTGKESRCLGDTPEEKQFKHDAYYLLVQARNTGCIHNYAAIQNIINLEKIKIYTPLALDLNFYFTDMWGRDEDGGIKVMQDSLFNFLQMNDKLVTDLYTRKLQAEAAPHTTIELRMLTPLALTEQQKEAGNKHGC